MIPRLHLPLGLVPEAVVKLSPESGHYLLHVLRLRAGAEVILFDGQGGEWRGELVGNGRTAEVRLTAFDPVERRAVAAITLVQAVIKPQAMDWVVQKATELGVETIIPLQARRSPPRITREQGEGRLRHWRQIAIEACEQSGRTRLPAILPITPWEGLAERLPAEAPRHFLWEWPEEPGRLPLGQRLSQPRGDATLFIGPEGGWSREEAGWAMAQFHTLPCHLGPLTLRAETAAAVAVALCLL